MWAPGFEKQSSGLALHSLSFMLNVRYSYGHKSVSEPLFRLYFSTTSSREEQCNSVASGSSCFLFLNARTGSLDHITGAPDSSDYMQLPLEPQKTLPTYAVLLKTCKHTLSTQYVYNWWMHPLKLKRSEWTTVWN